MMKILALHGLGSSSSMFEQQLAPFTKGLGSKYQFTFFDGSVPCKRGPGVPSWVSEPFLSYATGFTPRETREALSRLEVFVEENGPFDGVFAFSLGASLTIAYILDRQRGQVPVPFAFAVFFSITCPPSSDDSYCEKPLLRWLSDDCAGFRAKFPEGDFMQLLDNPTERKFAECSKQYLALRSEIGETCLPNSAGDFFASGEIERIPRLVHPDLLHDRVKIPTVHVVGTNDLPTLAKQAKLAQSLCSPSIRRIHEHDGGHSVPYTASDVAEILPSIIEMSREGQEIRDFCEL